MSAKPCLCLKPCLPNPVCASNHVCQLLHEVLLRRHRKTWAHSTPTKQATLQALTSCRDVRFVSSTSCCTKCCCVDAVKPRHTQPTPTKQATIQVQQTHDDDEALTSCRDVRFVSPTSCSMKLCCRHSPLTVRPRRPAGGLASSGSRDSPLASHTTLHKSQSSKHTSTRLRKEAPVLYQRKHPRAKSIYRVFQFCQS
jgi:hypothetical protein